MKVKTITLISGNENHIKWNLVTRVKKDGLFDSREHFMFLETSSEKKRAYERKIWKTRESVRLYRLEYHREHPESVQRAHTKRKRGLGFEPINEWFEGAHAHHITKNIIIYIPEALHRSVSHNIWTGEGMEEINKLAFDFLKMQKKNSRKKKLGKPRNLMLWEGKKE